MSISSNSPPAKPQEPKPPFSHLVTIQPLGLLYGSAGRFLSPENLVWRSGSSFPPTAATLSGIFAAKLRGDIKNLQLAGPFWGKFDELPDFYVSTPLNCLIEKGKSKIKHKLTWKSNLKKWIPNVNEKFEKGGWLKVHDWQKEDGKLR